MRSAEIRRDHHYTYADYLKFPDDERWEIIDGVAYSMAPAPGVPHQNLLGEVHIQVGSQLRGKPCAVFVAPIDVRFERSNRADKIVQPDLVVVCDRSKITERGIVGAPDWIVEVISPSSAGRDQIVKRALYEAQAVREYWLVHPIDRVLTIYRLQPNGTYGVPEIVELVGQTAVQAVPALVVDWALWQPLQQDDDEA